jgi:phage terminase large subunit-like protein
VELVGTVLDPTPPPSLAGWMPRGQGKSALVAALGLYDLMLGDEGASVVVVATDERQAGIVFGAAARMVELHPELAARCRSIKTGWSCRRAAPRSRCYPRCRSGWKAWTRRWRSWTSSGVISRDVYEVIALAAGKREVSLTLGIGTPPADWSDSVLADMRTYAAEHPEDETFAWREYSAAGFEDHPVDCRHCWTVANPALGDFLSERIIASFLPPKTREATFRRARLCQFAEELADPWLPPRAWDACADTRPIPDRAEVILALDGSFSQDATALVAAEVGDVPHLDVAGL